MRTSLQRIRFGALVLTVIFVVAVLGYRFYGGYDWVGAVWMVVITISSVGYGERSENTPGIQLLSIFVIILGMSAAAYTVGGLIQMMLEGEIERALGYRRLSRGISKLKDHVIICGFGRIGKILAEELQRQNRPFIVLDNDPEVISEARGRDYLCLSGDATEEDILVASGVDRAKTLVTVLPQDAANVFITLTTRDLNPDIQILARAEMPSTDKKLRQAGADRIVMPSAIGAQQIVRIITRPTTADLMELVAESEYLDVELDELSVNPQSKLIGTSVADTEAHRKHRLLVVAVKLNDGEMLFNPEADFVFEAGNTIIIMGRVPDIKEFREEFGL